MARYKTIALLLLLSAATTFNAQTPQEQYAAFKQQARQQYDDFRNRANQQYAEFVKQAWQHFNSNEPILNPYENPMPPVVCPEEEKNKERRDEKKHYEDVLVVKPPKPQPMPIEPVTPVEPPKPINPVTPKKEIVAMHFFGTEMQCTVTSKPQFTLPDISGESISEAWQQLSNGQCNELLSQCLELRNHHQLNDWGYMLLLDSISQSCCQQDNNATLLMAWLYCQSGYKMRLARADGYIFMLFASENTIYNRYYFAIDNDLYYPYEGENIDDLYVCNASFPNEQSMTLEMSKEPLLANRKSSTRTLQPKQYNDFKVSTSVNQNLISFYNKYPSGSVNGDFGTRWAIYANTPLSEEVRQVLYPQLHQLLQSKNKLQATEELLNLVQTAFVYEYDSIVWGEDRAFFPEETLFYPFSDCEDRAILFSRLVRDLLDLRVVLLYYPDHLATAVRFEGEQPTGDYLELTDGRYFVADPTYIGAPIGLTMPQCRDKGIKVIMLK